MKKVIETMLTTPSARNPETAKNIAYAQTDFTPWAGDEE